MSGFKSQSIDGRRGRFILVKKVLPACLEEPGYLGGLGARRSASKRLISLSFKKKTLLVIVVHSVAPSVPKSRPIGSGPVINLPIFGATTLSVRLSSLVCERELYPKENGTEILFVPFVLARGNRASISNARAVLEAVIQFIIAFCPHTYIRLCLAEKH